MSDIEDEALIKSSVKELYSGAAERKSTGCCCEPSCCGSGSSGSASLRMGYKKDDLEALPQGTDLGLGCGNPSAIAALKSGETVLDLGSGAGMDCLLAARAVGDGGRVIGVDMTPEMVQKARVNAARFGLSNVEFRLGEIEHLPVEPNFADVVMSNCAINLSPDKLAVWREAYRALKPGGRLAIADVAATKPVPENIRRDLGLWSCCAAGAQTIDELSSMLELVGFKSIRIEPRVGSKEIVKEWTTNPLVADYFTSVNIEAVKPVQ